MSNIKQKTKIGIIWNLIEKISVQVVGFVLNIILARLLTPHDYGTIGMLTVFLTFSNVFIDSGFSRALIQRQDRTETDFSTTLIFNVAVSCILYGALFFLAPLIASFYKAPELVGLQRVLFLVVIPNSLVVVQSARLQIAVDFQGIALINFASTLLSGVVAIISAHKGWGPWALVVQAMARALSSSSLYWIFGRWMPRTGFSRESFGRLFGFGAKLLASGLLSTTITNVNNLLIGKYYAPASLGFFTRAQQFPELTAGAIASVLNNTTFPLMASLQDDVQELVSTLRRLIRLTALVVFPAMTGLACLSEPIIAVLLGEKWLPAADLLLWLSAAYIFTPLSILNMNVLNAIGRSDLFLRIDLVKIPLILLTMMVTFPVSLKAVVIGRAVTAFIYFYINGFLIGRMYNFGASRQILASWKYIVSSVVMGTGVVLIDKCFDANLLTLFLVVFSGAVIYSLSLALLREQEFCGILRKVIGAVRCRG